MLINNNIKFKNRKNKKRNIIKIKIKLGYFSKIQKMVRNREWIGFIDYNR